MFPPRQVGMRNDAPTLFVPILVREVIVIQLIRARAGYHQLVSGRAGFGQYVHRTRSVIGGTSQQVMTSELYRKRPTVRVGLPPYIIGRRVTVEVVGEPPVAGDGGRRHPYGVAGCIVVEAHITGRIAERVCAIGYRHWWSIPTWQRRYRGRWRLVRDGCRRRRRTGRGCCACSHWRWRSLRLLRSRCGATVEHDKDEEQDKSYPKPYRCGQPPDDVTGLTGDRQLTPK